MSLSKVVDFFKTYLQLNGRANKFIFLLSIITLALIIFTINIIMQKDVLQTPDPSKIIGLILADLIVLLSLASIISYKFFKYFLVATNSTDHSKLQKRVIFAFSCVAAIPTIIVSVFSVYFFNFGLQVWFDQKISTVLDQSINVAESYIAEHKARLKESAAATADDLNEMYYDVMHDQSYLSIALNAEAEMRSLDEAIVFHRSTNTILAQTLLSFSLAFLNIPIHMIDKANHGEVVEISSDPTKIRMLVKLKEYEDVYMIIGRLIDNQVINHIDQTNGAASTYNRLKSNIASMQIKFSAVFIVIALLLLLAAISWGAFFSKQIVSPILRLVAATDKVKAGDLTANVPENNLKDDEIRLLSSAFNRMIEQLNRQQRDLLIAQRSLAWSDVARRVAHEIKNPLTPIQLAAERLSKKFRNEITSDQDAYDRYIKTIMRHTNDIKEIVAEFVNFARLPLPNFREEELVSLVLEMVECRKALNDKIKYTFSSNEKSIDFVCDVAQIRQIMTNLLKNAEEALDQTLVNPNICVLITKINQVVSIKITDNGVGFAKDSLAKATDAYFTTRQKGTGLGLAIVKKIVEDHLGHLEIVNNMDGGAAVTLIFDAKELKYKL